MRRKNMSYAWYKALRKYRRLQARLQEAELPELMKHLSLKLRRLQSRIFRLNRQLKLGIAAAALTAWMAAPVQAQHFPPLMSLDTLNGTHGFSIAGRSNESYAGISVSNAGDVNGDGIDDILIGAESSMANDTIRVGEAYVVFGNNSGFNAQLDLSSLNGTNGFYLKGTPDSYAGNSVAAAGDINGDGFDDIIVGAPETKNANGVFAGAAYVVFGKNSGFPASIDLAALDGTDGFMFMGADGSRTGRVAGGGDLNKDGIDDIIIAAPEAASGGAERGEVYVVFGKTTAFSDTLDYTALNGSNGFTLLGTHDYDNAGVSVDFAGDINGDGIDDIIIGAYGAKPINGSNEGLSYVVFGKSTPFSSNMALSSLNGSNGFVISGLDPTAYSGHSVSKAGDINGDGMDDLIIGAPLAEPGMSGYYEGESYVVFGKITPFADTLSAGSLDGLNGFVIRTSAASNGLGAAVDAAGDLNGDGFDDLIIGSPVTNRGPLEYVGGAHIVFGASSFGSPFSVTTLDGMNGFSLLGVGEYDLSGISVGGGGDFNGDGIPDVIIGASYSDGFSSTLSYEGGAYVVFGRDINASLTPSLEVFPMSMTPNPSSGLVHIQSDLFGTGSQPQIRLFDLSGREIPIFPNRLTQKRYQLDVSHLPTGIYQLRVLQDGKMKTQKLVKK